MSDDTMRARLAAMEQRALAAERERDGFKEGCEYRGAVLTEARASVNEQGDYLHDADGDLARAVRMLGGDLRFNIEKRSAAEFRALAAEVALADRLAEALRRLIAAAETARSVRGGSLTGEECRSIEAARAALAAHGERRRG